MEPLILPLSDCKQDDGIRIESATGCDGSICHQPIFREDGNLNLVPPHCHLVTREPEGDKYHLVLCDFPVPASAPVAAERRTSDPIETAFAEYLASELPLYFASEHRQ